MFDMASRLTITGLVVGSADSAVESADSTTDSTAESAASTADSTADPVKIGLLVWGFTSCPTCYELLMYMMIVKVISKVCSKSAAMLQNLMRCPAIRPCHTMR